MPLIKKPEIRFSLSKNLYEHIAKEANSRYTTMAAVIREKLATNFLSQERCIKHVMPPIPEQNNLTHNEVSMSIQQTEKRLLSAISRVEKLLESTEDRLRLLIAMVISFILT